MAFFGFFSLLLGAMACSEEEATENGDSAGLKGGSSGSSGKGGSSGSGDGGSSASGGSLSLGGASGTGGGLSVGQGGGGSGAGGGVCAEAKVKFDRGRAIVALLFDQSLSMDNKFGDGTRWTVLRDALLDPSKGFIKALEGEMDFGLTLYTGTAATCPLLTTVAPAPSNYEAIKTVFSGAVPTDNTPTGISVATLTAQLKALPGDLPRHIVLATDGAPDTCEVPNPANDAEKKAARQASIDAVTAAFQAGIQTHVIGVSKDIAATHLQELANVGAGKPLSDKEPFAVALDPASLTDALSGAINGARSCQFSLKGKVKPGQESSGSVLLDGASLAYGGDWKVTSESSVELLGQACEKLQKGEPAVEISFPCESYTPADIQ